MKNIFLIEDHHEALRIWREKRIRNVDLVHLDAHIDFSFWPVKSFEQIVREARKIEEMKRELEKLFLYQRYDKDLNKQTHIGNYIYPAMCEGIVRDFWWVIPGGLKEFKKSLKFIKNMLKSFARQDPYLSGNRFSVIGYRVEEGIISAKLLGKNFFVCVLEKLPILKQKVLLDIDLDFLTTDSLLNANNTSNIARRIPWIYPDKLVETLKEKIKRPEVITIAYSVNGGYTPIGYKFLGDDIAHRFLNNLTFEQDEFLLRRYKANSISDWQSLLRDIRYALHAARFEDDFKKRFLADIYFNLFSLTNEKKYYLNAIKLNPSYRTGDNNYGPLYLAIHKFSKAEREFLKIAKVDSKNPYPFIGLGEIYLQKRDFLKAKRHFSDALKIREDLPRKINIDISQDLAYALFGLAQVNFRLKNLKKAKRLFHHYQTFKPLDPRSYYFLARIYEEEKSYQRAAQYYQDAMRLGLNSLDIIKRLLKVSHYIREKDDIIKYVLKRYEEFKEGFTRYKLQGKGANRLKKSVKDLKKIKKEMAVLERMIASQLTGYMLHVKKA